MTRFSWFKIGLLMSTACLLGGCLSRPQLRENTVEIAPNLFIEMPLPKSLGYCLSASQLVSVDYQGEQHQLPVQLQVDPERLVLAGFSSWGSRIMSLTYEEGTISTSVMSGLGKKLPDPEQILFNLMITLWPLEAWEEPLQAIGWRLEGTSKQRQLMDQNQQVMATIVYEKEPDLDGTIVFMNHLLGLKITIKTLNYSR